MAWESWHNVLALRAIQRAGIEPDDPIADLGCRNGVILAWLHHLGYRQVYGCDLSSPLRTPLSFALKGGWTTARQYLQMYLASRQRLRKAPIEATGLPGGHFAAVTCMSVIEHGVNVPAFFGEAHRLLRPGGLLLLSTDYWPEPIDMGGLKRYQGTFGNDRIFDRAGALELCELGEAAGLQLLGRPEMEVEEPVVQWDGRSYTFLFLAFRKQD